MSVIEQVRALQDQIELLDARLNQSTSTTVDEDGWITGYRIPVGPWHRIIALSRSITTGRAESGHMFAEPCGQMEGTDQCWYCGQPKMAHPSTKGASAGGPDG